MSGALKKRRDSPLLTRAVHGLNEKSRKKVFRYRLERVVNSTQHPFWQQYTSDVLQFGRESIDDTP
jgi:hypothetical protein